MPKKGNQIDLPMSEGTASKKFVGLTDDEVKSLIGPPEDVSRPSPDGRYPEMWMYRGEYIKPPEGARPDAKPRALLLYFKNGQVVKVARGG